MSGHTTRRDFLGKAVAAGGCLALGGVGAAAHVAEVEKPAVDSASVADIAPIAVIVQEVSRDENPRAPAWVYIAEILKRGGVFFEQLSPSDLPGLAGQTNRIVVLAGDLRLKQEERDALAGLVEAGGSLIGIGGTSGLENVFGVSSRQPLMEGWIKVIATDHAVTSGLRSSLHVFGGYAVKAASATSLAELDSGSQGAKGSAVLENSFGKGRAILLAPDLIFSIVHIQQGVPVLQDGKPSPDDSAPINEGELKAEDGLVLDWVRDRTPMEPDGVPAFLEPITDELREIILKSIFHSARAQGIALPVLWYWPRGLKAVGHISHDTDGHDPNKAVAMLGVLNRCRVKSTWCTLYPGGYPRKFYDKLKQQDFEIALHYDARTGGAETSWSKENFLLQHRWLKETAGLETIVSNKNHYTRWEGRLDFLRWCEEVGMTCDQTRGPSKQGTIGFPLGGSQPYFALDDEGPSPRMMNVMQVNMMTQDLVVVCPAEYGRQLVDSVLRHHGVAHFLFHPAHIQKPNVADTLSGVVDYGREKGLEWWTNRQIYEWEMVRRAVEARFGSGASFTLQAAEPVREAMLLLLKPGQGSRSISVKGQATKCEPWSWHGFDFDAVALDVAGEVKVEVG